MTSYFGWKKGFTRWNQAKDHETSLGHPDGAQMQPQVSLQEEGRGGLDTDGRGEDDATVKAVTAVRQVQAKDPSNTSKHQLEGEGNRPCPRASGRNIALHVP